jgi:tetratricopeptide (TPR) repeat protein
MTNACWSPLASWVSLSPRLDEVGVEQTASGTQKALNYPDRRRTREAHSGLPVKFKNELWRGNRAAARPLFLESLELAGQAGNAAVVGRNQLWLAEAAFDDGDDDAARAWAEQALASADAIGSRLNASMGLRLLGDVEARQGHVDRARELFETSLAHAEQPRHCPRARHHRGHR